MAFLEVALGLTDGGRAFLGMFLSLLVALVIVAAVADTITIKKRGIDGLQQAVTHLLIIAVMVCIVGMMALRLINPQL
mgnify:CR=1 FL=1